MFLFPPTPQEPPAPHVALSIKLPAVLSVLTGSTTMGLVNAKAVDLPMEIFVWPARRLPAQLVPIVQIQLLSLVAARPIRVVPSRTASLAIRSVEHRDAKTVLVVFQLMQTITALQLLVT